MLSTEFLPMMMLQITMAMCLATIIKGAKVEELSEDLRTPPPALTYQILNADHFFLKDISQASMENYTQQSQKQPFIITGLAGKPTINISFGPMSVEQSIPLELINTGPRVRAFTLARQVRSASPIIHLLFYATNKTEDMMDLSSRVSPGWSNKGYICVTAHAFWKSQEIRGTCSISENGGFCLAKLRPEPAWFSPASARSSKEHRDFSHGTTVEIYYQTRPSPTSQCIPQDSKQWHSPTQEDTTGQQYRSILKKVGNVNLLRSPPGNPMFMRLRLGGAVIIQTSSKPLKTTGMATFYVFLSSSSQIERFILRATVNRGLSFNTVRPSDTQLWDITLDVGRPGDTQTVFVTCQRKSSITAKRGLLEVLQLDFDAREQDDPAQIQTITWHLERPGNPIRDEGTMRIYMMRRDYVGIAALMMNSDILNTAVLNGKMVSVPVKVLGVETDGSVSDITNSTRCSSTDEDTLKVSEGCDYVFLNGKETRGRVRMMLNFTYSYLSTQLEVSVWMPRLPLQIDMADSELSQIKGWRVQVSTASQRPSWDSEEDDEKKVRGCIVQYQHSQIQVLTAFTAEVSNSSASSPEHFLGPEWLVDVTWLVRYSLKVGNTSIAQLHRKTVLSGRAPGVTTVQVMSPLSDSVLGKRKVQVLDDKVSITDLSVQLVSNLSLSFQPSPGSNRAIAAMVTTQDTMHNPKQEAVVACWLHFSDGSWAHLNLFDPSSYKLTVSSLDNSVVSVRKVPGHVMVAESEGWGMLIRAELAICEACQKSRRKSKLIVGAGNVTVKFFSSENRRTQTEAKLILTPFQGLIRRDINTAIQEGTIRDISATSAKSRLQEAIGGDLSTIRVISNINGMTATKPDTENGLTTVNPVKMLTTISDLPLEPKQEVPKHEQDLVWTFGIFTHVEICIYLFLGLSCLAIIIFLINCYTPNVRLHGRKSPVQCQCPNEHTHHWVRLGMAAEQSDAIPTETTVNHHEKVPCTTEESPKPAMQNSTERIATLGRKCNTLPVRTNPVTLKSAGPLAKPTRDEPLHSPTSKRNQVQFTTFTTLDIKHLAALKRNWLEVSWTNQGANPAANQGEQANVNRTASQSVERPEPEGLSEIPWPVVKAVVQGK
ncbi:transmembrane protein 132D [Tachysurus vachellii]|uniref:transmembrane protein 132D n=1 Tax=Tachysurus vachellii TaxID=175792 RepID=UPI00296B3BD4|nr:transmembrane protein 132D [Tachysurus vachellii]